MLYGCTSLHPGPCTAHAKPGLDGSFIESEPKLILLKSVTALHLDPTRPSSVLVGVTLVTAEVMVVILVTALLVVVV